MVNKYHIFLLILITLSSWRFPLIDSINSSKIELKSFSEIDYLSKDATNKYIFGSLIDPLVILLKDVPMIARIINIDIGFFLSSLEIKSWIAFGLTKNELTPNSVVNRAAYKIFKAISD